MGVKDESQPCVSLDCPIMFRRVLAKQDVQKGTQLREVVNKVLDFWFFWNITGRVDFRNFMWTVSGTLWCFLQRRHLLIKSLFVLMKIVKLLKQNKKQLQGNVYPTVCTVKAAVCCVMRRQCISMKLNYLYYQYCENYVLQVYKNTGLIQNCDIGLNLTIYICCHGHDIQCKLTNWEETVYSIGLVTERHEDRLLRLLYVCFHKLRETQHFDKLDQREKT